MWAPQGLQEAELLPTRLYLAERRQQQRCGPVFMLPRPGTAHLHYPTGPPDLHLPSEPHVFLQWALWKVPRDVHLRPHSGWESGPLEAAQTWTTGCPVSTGNIRGCGAHGRGGLRRQSAHLHPGSSAPAQDRERGAPKRNTSASPSRGRGPASQGGCADGSGRPQGGTSAVPSTEEPQPVGRVAVLRHRDKGQTPGPAWGFPCSPKAATHEAHPTHGVQTPVGVPSDQPAEASLCQHLTEEK